MAKPRTEPEVIEGPAIVFPVEGRFLTGIPAVPLVADDQVAERLVATGAFTRLAPEVPEPDPVTGITEAPEIAVAELPPGALAALDFYAPAPVPADTQEA